MQNNATFEKITRSRANSGKPDSRADTGKQWKRETKQSRTYSQK
jgi:hypothetical protein